jgi:signal peptidase I
MSPSSSPSSRQKQPQRFDTFNQIILMLVLAFTFRTFIVEAFVIPTGSMAPTLKGAHSRFVCQNCGYHYDVNFSIASDDGSDVNVPPAANYPNPLVCPNCGYPVPDEERGAVPVHYGDRILVLKYAYLLNQPNRWDVVVFKTPSQFERYKYSQAFIKRLVGKPGEQVMILDGDIYTAPASDPNPNWQIQRKPDHVQNDLWRIVNDTSYSPLGLSPDTTDVREAGKAPADYVPWQPLHSNTWRYSRDATGAAAFEFSELHGKGELRFDPAIGQSRYPLTDWLAYDEAPGQPRRWAVPDLKISLFYTRSPGSGTGPLQLYLSKRNDLFIARFLPDSVELYKSELPMGLNSPQLLAKAPCTLTDRPHRIDFMNLDYRVRVLVDGKELLATTDQQYSPNVAYLLRKAPESGPLPQIGISAENQVCTISHLSLWRDIYYTTIDRYSGTPVLRATPERPAKLGPDEYFVLGDNSPLSGDCRYWNDTVNLTGEDVHAQAGVVPARFMLGRAFVVYWPAGYRLIRYGNASLDAIPNFGELRFIH